MDAIGNGLRDLVAYLVVSVMTAGYLITVPLQWLGQIIQSFTAGP